MNFRLAFAMLALPLCTAFAQQESWSDGVARLLREKEALAMEEQGINAQIQLLEERTKLKEENIELLRQRLGALGKTEGTPQTLDEAAASGLGEENRKLRQDELLSGCKDRIVILRAENGKSSPAFIASQEGKARVFASAPWIAANGGFSVSDLNGNAIPIAQDIGCPSGIGLIALQPEPAEVFSEFVMAGENEVPAVGAAILVVLADGDTKALSGIGGSIRGIGPDTLEIDAELTPRMSGAPVLSLADGKLIGIVAEQVTGVEEDWARGTRHEGSRNFVARMDRPRDWQSSDLGRFAKEAAYIAKESDRNRIAWIAHTLLECAAMRNSEVPFPEKPRVASNGTHYGYYTLTKTQEQANMEWKEELKRMEELSKVALGKSEKYPGNSYISRAKSWAKNSFRKDASPPDGGMDRTLISFYRDLHTDLSKKQPDPSAHLSPYHREGYRYAMEERAEGIRTLTERINRIVR